MNMDLLTIENLSHQRKALVSVCLHSSLNKREAVRQLCIKVVSL